LSFLKTTCCGPLGLFPRSRRGGRGDFYHPSFSRGKECWRRMCSTTRGYNSISLFCVCVCLYYITRGSSSLECFRRRKSGSAVTAEPPALCKPPGLTILGGREQVKMEWYSLSPILPPTSSPKLYIRVDFRFPFQLASRTHGCHRPKCGPVSEAKWIFSLAPRLF